MEQLIEFSQNHKLTTLAEPLRYSLTILSMNNVALMEYVQNAANENPFLLIEEEAYQSEIFDSEYNLERIPAKKNLKEDLYEQLSFLDLSATEKEIALDFIDYAVSNNFLSAKEIQRLQKIYNKDYSYFLNLIDKLKTLTPSKNFSLNIIDKINFELGNQKDISEETFKAVIRNISLLISDKINEFKAACHLSDEDFLKILDKLKRLKITEQVNDDFDENFVIPDLILDFNKGIHLNAATSPELKFDAPLYKESINHIRNANDQKFIIKHAKEAKMLISSLKHRSLTLVKIAKEIVSRQFGFFYYDKELIPIKIADIANSTFLHESTINRAISQKSIKTPAGTFALRHLVPKNIKNNYVSDEAVRLYLKKLIENEPTSNPYSDEQIVYFLTARGVHVSRRTISKYRSDLNIPNSLKRRKNSQNTFFSYT